MRSHYALLSLLFVVGLELIFALQRWLFIIVIGTLAVVALGIVLIKLEDGPLFRWVHTLLPIVAIIGLSGFAFLLPTTSILHVYIIAAGVLLFLLLQHGARQAYPLWNWALSLVVYFLNVAFALGLNFHLYLPTLATLVMVAVMTALISYQALTRVVPLARQSVVPILGMTLAIAEVVWAMQFWPVHYLVEACVLTALYYVIFNLLGLSYMKRLTRKDVLEYAGIGVATALLILVTAQWT
ncbi:MAG TPA: hypothetical protein VJC05_03725 [Candidatus Andersenbacteria bacterium]|nr:hypothetical protein [Candidatus Andersenbacteria bacterium]